MRRTLVVLCSGGPYHVPTLARVALFPIHLDPPTRQHRELFRLLLGAPDLSTPARSPAVSLGNHTAGPTISSSSHANDGGGFSQGAMSGGHPDYARQGAQGTTSAAASSSLLGGPGASTLAAPSSSSSSSPSGMADGEPMSCGTSSPFWYMEAFATSLREDSQLAPFDDVILIPYTRGPVSLRQSTHLAAMAVLAARGLAHVHVDFTALEHPDESMPIIYELVCKYTNSALVHFLQDAYEMQNWSHFSEFKNSVPMMLLQTQSFPPRALERQRPLGSVSRLTSRQYHSPTGPYVHTAAEAAYYRQAEQFMAASAALRRRNPNPMALTGEDTERAEGVEGEMRERYESASLVDRESDYFADEPDLASHRGKGGVTSKGAERNSSSWVWTEADMMKGTLPPSGRGTLASRSPHPSSDHDERQPSSGHAWGRVAEERGDRGGADSADHSQESWLASSHDGGARNGLGLNYADCARGRWWNTVGGRGDDEVELSRCYWSSTSSSWLGGGTGAASSLPDWMEEVGAVNARAKLDQHQRSSSSGNEGSHAPAVDAAAHAGAAAAAASQQGPASESGAVVAPLDGIDGVLSAAGIVGADRAHFDLDTVVSDDGFALAVDGRPGDCSRAAEGKGGATGAAATAYASSSSTGKHAEEGEKAPAAASAPQPGGKVRSAEARESADEDTRKRYLTREMEEVQKMLDGMLHSTAAQRALLASSSSSASTASAQQGAGPRSAVSSASQPSNTAAGGSSAQPSSSSSQSLLASSHAASSSRGAPHAFGLYATHHHDVHSHTRRRHRCVRQLLEELFPPRLPGPPSVAASTTATALSALEQGMHEMYASAVPSHRFGGSDGHDAEEGGDGGAKPAGSRRSVSSASIFTAAVKTSPTHVSLLQHAARILRGPGDSSGDASVASEPPASMGHPPQHSDSNNNSSSGGGGGASSWIDAPLVEVHPITRSTGADVRQALWEQDIHPSSILMDCVQRYMEGHGLYRDPRKATAASLYAGIAGYEVNRGGGGGGGVGGIGGTGSDVNVAFRDPAMAGSGSTSSSSISAGSAIMDGRSGVRRVAPRDTSTLSFPGLIPRLELHYDRNNLLAREQYEKLRIFQCHDGDEPDLIVPIGGDGYMMHCIRKNWRRFIPFYGVNAGHVGYLLNDRATLEELFSSPLKLHFTTMLYCQAEKESDTGERMLLSELAFNDAWVERSSGQTALIRILVNGQERIRRLRGDGVLVSTAAGSTAYSQALGASPVPVGAPLIQVVGSNVVSPAQWRPAHLDQEDQVEFEVIDSTKRPCRCYVDSVDVGNVTRLLVRSSRVAGVTLAFSKSCDLQHKLYQMQFPKTL